MPIPETSTNLPALSASDFANPATAATRINQITQFLAQQIASIQGATGPIQLKGTVYANLFKQFLAPTKLPTDPAQVVTWWDLQNFSGSSSTTTGVVTGGGGGGGSTVPSPFNLVFDGDSLMLGDYSSTADPIPTKVGTRLSLPNGSYHNLGVAGAKTADVIATHVAIADGLYGAAPGTNWYILLIGVNDFLNSVPIATTQANIHTIITGRKAKGFNTLVITNTPQNLSGAVPGYESWRDQMRAWYLAGSSTADFVLNLGDMSVFTNTALTLWFNVDELHISDLGYLLMSAAIASFLLQSIGGFSDLLPPQAYPGAAPINTNFTSYDINVESYGVMSGANGVELQNGNGIERAALAAYTAGVGLYFPGQQYKTRKFNIPYGIRVYSTCFNPAVNAFSALGTRLICDGTGTSWLKAVFNSAVPNGGNTGPDATAIVYGLQVSGFRMDVKAGVTAIDGFWLVRNYMFKLEDCGVYPNSAAAWASSILLDTGVIGQLIRPVALWSSVGIGLGGPTSTGPTVLVSTIDPIIANCAVGFGTAYSQFCNLYRGTIQSCSTAGYVGAGPSNSLFDTVFGSGGATNTLDYTEIASSAPPFGGGAYVNNYKVLRGCTFNSQIQFKGSTGTSVLDNICNSSLSIDSACVGTVLNQQSKFFTSFTDSSTTTYYTGPTIFGTGAPTGSQGIRTQRYCNIATITAPVEYIVTVSGTPATWAPLGGGGGGGLTTINPGGNTGPAITFDSGTGTTASSPSANHIRYDVALASGTGINVAGATITNTAPYTAPTPVGFSPSASFTGGSVASVSVAADYITLGPGHRVGVSGSLNFTVTGGTVTSFTLQLPFTAAVAGAAAFGIGNGSAAFGNAATFQAGVTVITVTLINTLPPGTYGTTFDYGLFI